MKIIIICVILLVAYLIHSCPEPEIDHELYNDYFYQNEWIEE